MDKLIKEIAAKRNPLNHNRVRGLCIQVGEYPSRSTLNVTYNGNSVMLPISKSVAEVLKAYGIGSEG